MAPIKSILLFWVLTSVYAQDPATIDIPDAEPSDAQSSIERFTYIGCLSADFSSFTSPDSASGFIQLEESDVMSLNVCISDCYNYAYAAIYNTQCFCSSSPDALSELTSATDQLCRNSCPGLLSQKCGGSVSTANFKQPTSKQKRQEDGSRYYVMLYKNTAFVSPGIDPIASSMSASASTPEIDNTVSSQLTAPDRVKLTAGPPHSPTQMYGFVTASAISARYTTLCNMPMCPTAYLSETATTILVLSTNTQPSPTLTVPMSTTTVTYEVIDGDGKELPTSTELKTPDESAIADIEGEVQYWVTKQQRAETVLGGRSNAVVDSIAEEAGRGLDGGDGTVSPAGSNGGTGGASGSGGVTGDGGPMIERRSVFELEGRREDAKRRLLDELEAEVAIGVPELRDSQGNHGKEKRSYSPFAEAVLVESDLQPEVFFGNEDWHSNEDDEDDEDEDDEDEDDEEDDEETDDEYPDETRLKRDTPPDDESLDEDGPSLPYTLDGHDVELGLPLLLDPADNTPISVNEAEKIVHDKRNSEADGLPIQFEIKFAPEVREDAKGQSPAEASAAASIPLLSYSITDGSVRTIDLMGTQQSSASNSSIAPYPVGDATVACPTATGNHSFPSNGPASVAGQVTQVIDARPSMAHPVARPDKYLRYALVTMSLISTVLLDGDVLSVA